MLLLHPAPRLGKTPSYRLPLFASTNGIPPRGNGRCPRCVRGCVSRRRVVTSAVGTELLFSDTVAASSPEGQAVTLAVVGGIGFAALLALGAATQGSPKGKVVGLSGGKLESMLKEKGTVLFDIRSRTEVKEMGSPSMKGMSARTKALSFKKRSPDGTEVAVEKYGELFAKKSGAKENSVVILMDADGRSASTAGRAILNFSDLGTVYYVSGGASAMEAAGFQWKKASTQGASFSLPSLPKVNVKGFDLDKFAETYKNQPTLVNSGLAVGALAAAGVVLFNEFDVILETVGILGGIQLLYKQFFYAEDRDKTIKEIRSLFDDKIVANEAGEDLKRLASTIIEVPTDATSSKPSSVSSISPPSPTNDKVPV